MSEETFYCANNHELAIQDGYCKECAVCAICKSPLTPAEYFQDLRTAARESDASAGIIVNPIFTHSACILEQSKPLLAVETVTIPRELFNHLNQCRLLIEPMKLGGMRDDEVLAAKTQEMDAGLQASYWISESAKTRTSEQHQEYLYQCLRRMETICAAASLALSKSRRVIELKLDQKVAAQNEEARRKRQEMEERPTPKTAAKIERKALTREEKAIQGFMKTLGCSEAEATEIYNSTIKKGQGEQINA